MNGYWKFQRNSNDSLLNEEIHCDTLYLPVDQEKEVNSCSERKQACVRVDASKTPVPRLISRYVNTGGVLERKKLMGKFILGYISCSQKV